MLPKLWILVWVVVVCLGIVCLWPFWSVNVAIAVLASVLAAIFQIWAAYHAKVSHFLECFSRCNKTYAKLNEQLWKTPPPQDAIIDYFNLCAEEYLMHKMGVIPNFVWDVWCAGIHDCACQGPIKAEWDKEMKKNLDYYGFDLEKTSRKHHKARP
jgi:hypothetical protein